MLATLRATPALLTHPLALLRRYPREAMRGDLLAGATVGMVLLPQALAFSLLAGLPPEMGLYAAIVASIAGALWGSSSHLNTGPTNTASILTLATLAPIAAPGSPAYVAAAGLVAVLAGGLRLALGLARLGLLVNFVSDSVAVGFTAGAGILIISNQLGPITRLDLPDSGGLLATLAAVWRQLASVHLATLALGTVTIALTVLLRRINRRLPNVLLAIALLGALAWALGLERQGVRVLGPLPAGLPPLAALPLFDLELIGHLSSGALALGIIGLVESVSIARAVAAHSRQRLDSNQEFVGQGVANIFAGVFSGYPCSGSFNRSALTFQSGGQSAMANVFSGLFVLAATFALGPLIAQLPRAVLAGTLALTAFGMIDFAAIRRIWRGAPGEAVILLITLVATLLLPLQFAVLAGVLMSLGLYILRTSLPQVRSVLPDANFRHWEHRPGKPECPQLGVVDVLGDLYFGAINHVEERLFAILQADPRRRLLLLRMHSVLRCDISGIRGLETILRACRERGGDLFMVRVREEVQHTMDATGFDAQLGPGRVLEEDRAIGHLFNHLIDPAVCIYECEVRAFRECQNLPKRTLNGVFALPADARARLGQTPTLPPHELWQLLREPGAPLVVVDVREPREFRQGHIPQARLVPLPTILAAAEELPREQPIVLVCRSGRRSALAAALLDARGYGNLRVLAGGMLAWEAANLLEATT
jgi:sulfate permease, SulP family